MCLNSLEELIFLRILAFSILDLNHVLGQIPVFEYGYRNVFLLLEDRVLNVIDKPNDT